MKPRIEIFPDKPTLVQRALTLVLEKLQLAIADRGRATIALAGGSTPKPLYEGIASQNLPWDKIHVFWGDERYVPPDHPDSNEGMARRAWLDRVALPPGNIHAMSTNESDPAIAAQRYDQELRSVFQVAAEEIPSFDVILLGMGDDGHTASLFPYTAALKVSDRLVTVGNKNGQPRLTFTVPLINRARNVLFLVAGADKQEALQQIFSSDADAMAFPARLVNPDGELWWLLDEAAATLIQPL
jgi:6-phosphogluconolactonase